MSESDIDKNVILLPVDFTQKALEELVSQVNSLVKSGGVFQLDGSKVEQTDCAAVQFLVVCQKYRSDSLTTDSAHSLMVAASEVLTVSMQQLGAQEYISSSTNQEQLQA